MNLRSLPRQFRFRWQRVVGALLGILLILTVTSWLWITGKAYQTPVPASLDTYALLVTSKDWVYEGTPRLPVVIAWIPILAVLVPVSMRSVRQAWYRRNNRCVQCGYSRRGLTTVDDRSTCPECGTVAICRIIGQ